jgi:hypothetical protein
MNTEPQLIAPPTPSIAAARPERAGASLGWIALALACLALAGLVVPRVGMFAAVGLGGFASAAGWVGFRRRDAASRARLAGSAALVLGALAVVLGAVRYGFTAAALRHLASLFAP